MSDDDKEPKKDETTNSGEKVPLPPRDWDSRKSEDPRRLKNT
ncbi:hypothetical protein [Neorhizobium galegae]|nr:hypothetical protein [Neorhizobium galegae]